MIPLWLLLMGHGQIFDYSSILCSFLACIIEEAQQAMNGSGNADLEDISSQTRKHQINSLHSLKVGKIKGSHSIQLIITNYKVLSNHKHAGGKSLLIGLQKSQIYQIFSSMKTPVALLVLLAVTVNCGNLQAEAQAFCPFDLYLKINNPPTQVNSGIYDFLNLIDTINNSTDALPVLRQIASFTPSHMINMLTLAQVNYQGEVDYNALDQATKDQCSVGMTLEDCQNTCVDMPVFAQKVAAPKPVGQCPETDPFCKHMADIGDYDQRKCLLAARPYVWRIFPEESPLVLPNLLYNAFAGSNICPNFNVLSFVSRECIDAYTSNLRNMDFAASLPMYKRPNIKESLSTENLLVQMQSVYSLAYAKFGHDLGRISMECRVLIRTDPVTNQEIDDYYASQQATNSTDISP